MSLKSADLHLTEDDSWVHVVGLRFRDVDIPRDATILGAHIQFATDETAAGPTSLTIEGEASDDAPGFEKEDRNVTSRSRTSGAVAWEPPPWQTGASGPDQRTPELRTIVQEIVDRPGWEPGNAMVFVISGTGHRTAHARYGVPERAPRLELEYLISTP
jgi:hypothetical protein